jgi:hypothetical protein
MFGGRLERRGSDGMLMISRKMDEGGIFEKFLRIDLPLEIEKGFNRKKYSVHRQEEGVEKSGMYPLFHFYRFL